MGIGLVAWIFEGIIGLGAADTAVQTVANASGIVWVMMLLKVPLFLAALVCAFVAIPADERPLLAYVGLALSGAWVLLTLARLAT